MGILPRVKNKPNSEEAAEEVKNNLKKRKFGEDGRDTRADNHKNELKKAEGDESVGDPEECLFCA